MKEIQILNNGDPLYDIRRKINENFELVQQEVEEGSTDPLAKFGVNGGNETDGVADLLNVTDGTLSFKVGGEYPNLVMTSGDGVTTEIENINDLYLQNLTDGQYTIVVDGSNSNITDAEFYSQLLEPENPNAGDVWFNGESAYEKKNSQPTLEELASTGLTLNTLTKLDNYYLAISSNNTLYTSEDDGVTWTVRTIAPSGNAAYIGCVAFKNAFFLLTSDRQLYRINKAWQLERITSIYNGDSVVPNKLLVQNDILFAFAGGKSIYYTTTNENYWTATGIPEATIPRDIVFVDGKYYLFDNSGKIFTSTNLTDWTATQHTIQTPSCAKLYGDNILIGCVNGYLLVFNLQSDTIRQITPLKQDASITDIDILADGGVLIVGHKGICAVSYDLQNFTQLLQRDNLITATEGNFIVGSSGIHCKLVLQSTWVPYTYIPVGEVTISGGEVTYFTTYPYNSNGLHQASSSSFGLLRTAATVDEMNCSCTDAVLTPSNLYDLNNYRRVNTEYNVDDKVGCPYHHNLQLKCTQAGTTSGEALNTKDTLKAGDIIEDGTVTWVVEQLGSASNALTTTQITNCITEIPQDIKLELNDGVLTLKAGSVVIVPYGTEDLTSQYPKGATFINDNFKVYDTQFEDGKFFVWAEVQNDLSNSGSTTVVEERFVFINVSENGVTSLARSESGTSNTSTNSYTVYYNTATNKVASVASGTTLNYSLCKSLPVAKVYSNTSIIYSSIDQVFNGFGYIGSTVFVTKGVKVLIPNGRNEDGTLNNIEFATTRVLVDKDPDITSRPTKIFLHLDKIESWGADTQNVMYYKTRPAVAPVKYCTAYIEDENKWIRSTETTEWAYEIICADVGDYQLNNGNIVAFYPKLPFRAVDYSELTSIVPTGTVISFAANSNPNGYILCNGSAVSRTTYANLFSVIGTTYGTGDGSTTFNLPNYTGYRFVTNTTVSVKGTGMGLGLTNGSQYTGLTNSSGTLRSVDTAYGKNVGTKYPGSTNMDTQVLGITTDASKSGITGTVSTTTIKWYIKY